MKSCTKKDMSLISDLKPGDLVVHTSDRVVGVLVEKSNTSELEDFWRVLCEEGEQVWSRYKCEIVSKQNSSIKNTDTI